MQSTVNLGTVYRAAAEKIAAFTMADLGAHNIRRPFILRIVGWFCVDFRLFLTEGKPDFFEDFADDF